MTRVSARSRAKVTQLPNAEESKENTKVGKDQSKNAKEATKNTKAVPEASKAQTQAKVRGRGERSSRSIVKEENLELAAELEALLKKVNVEAAEVNLNLKEEDDDEDEEEEEEDEEEEEEEELDDEADKEEDDVDEDGDEDDDEDEDDSSNLCIDEDKDRKETDIGYQCAFCEYTFTRKSMLKRHVRIHTGERPYACDKCDAKFTQQGGLKTHMLCKHRDQIDQKDKVTYQCHHCDRSFVIKERLRIHLRVHTGELPYVCHICSKKFRRNGGLLQHLRRHVGMRPYTCEICKASYYNSTNLKTHMKRHLGVQDYVCDLCGKGFTRRDGLRKHLACLHYDQCAFRCSICNKSFKGHILSHLRMHLKEKPFKCEICGMRFVQSSQLVVHTRTHTGAKPYPCQICKVAFSHSSALRMHIRRHTGEKPVKCLLCPAAFVQLPHLKKHMRCIHKTDKPYVCVPCNSFFKKKVELEEHMKAVGCVPAVAPEAKPSENASAEGSPPAKRSRKRSAREQDKSEGVTVKIQKLSDDEEMSPLAPGNGADPDEEVKEIPNLKGSKVVEAFYHQQLASDHESQTNVPVSRTNKNKYSGSANSSKSSSTIGNLGEFKSSKRPETSNGAPKSLDSSNHRETRSRVRRSVSSDTGNLKPKSSETDSDNDALTGLLTKSSSSSRRSSCDSKSQRTVLSASPKRSGSVDLAKPNSVHPDDPDDPDCRCDSPICEPLKTVDQPTSVMVEEMMRKVTERLKMGAKQPVVIRNQPMPIEKIRMLLAILLTRISTPERLETLGFGKVLIDKVLSASIVSSGRVPCDQNGLTEREVILKNVQILLEWTVPKLYMERFKREKRSTEDLLEELTS